MTYTTDFQQRNDLDASYKEQVSNLQAFTAELAKQATGIALFNPSDRVIVGRLSGQAKNGGSTMPATYRIPPEGLVFNTHTGKNEVSDGTLVVYDDVRQDPEQLKQWRQAGGNPQQIPAATTVFHTAAEVAVHLIRQNREFGLCALTGSPEEREAQKQAARQRFMRVRKDEAEKRILLAHKKAADAKAIGLPYQWSADEVRAQDYLNSLKVDEGAKVIRCRFKCGYWNYDEARVNQHIEISHPDELAGEVAAVEAAERAAAAEEKRGGRRKSAA